MDDLISKQQAIDALRGYLVEKRCPDDGTLTCRLIENEVINKLPSAEPKRGWWIEIINSRGVVVALRCSRCEKSPRHGVRSDFCPNCGAKMEVNNESN